MPFSPWGGKNGCNDKFEGNTWRFDEGQYLGKTLKLYDNGGVSCP